MENIERENDLTVDNQVSKTGSAVEWKLKNQDTPST
jgi:hypothetical protein